MLLYVAVPMNYARFVVERGFVGVERAFIEGGSAEFCEFRDIPPTGLTFSRTTEVTAEPTETGISLTIGGGGILADYIGDVVLSIDVPEAAALECEAREDPPAGWPFREFWLSPELANAHRSTLRAWVSESGEEIDPDLLRLEHAVVVTERFAAFRTEAGEAAPVGAVCVCGARWRWNSRDEENPGPGYAAFCAGH
jgi:hypothetical protein